NFLVAETEVGNISRQEAVSMVPPLFLDVQPGHIVLDMCAAPGSKTAQILEAIDQADSGDLLQGMVVANDADYERAHMLVRQSKRLHSPTLIVTCHDAQFLPSIRGTRASGRVVQFDRILADVPCSGDGTLRKNKQIWSSWNPKNGNALHRLQLLIAERGARLLKIGGRMVYSTCSLNPSENESVIAELIWITGGALRLVDVSRELPALKRAPGLTTWKVMSPKEVLYERWDDVPEADRNRTVFPTLFPPPNAAELHLERAMRIYPHYQDTGGFFVAVLEKVSEFGQMDQIS
ncbi:S-adenosyl-L-methionine-dependent methyltransferase, partial [Caulochytrium protostelioides]